MCSKESALSKLADWMRMFAGGSATWKGTSTNYNTINIKEDPQKGGASDFYSPKMLSEKQNQLGPVDQKRMRRVPRANCLVRFRRPARGGKADIGFALQMSAYDPKRTSGLPTPSRVPIRIATISEVQGRPR